MSKRLVLVLSILCTARAMARGNDLHWTEVYSPHFTVLTDSGEKDGHRIALEFERMQAVFQRLYPQLQVDAESPITILALKEKKVFRTLEPAAYLQKTSLKLHGLFLKGSEKNYILMQLGAETGKPFHVAFHEYTHLVLHQGNDSIPLWLSEGLAEFYANTEIRGQEARLGLPNLRHLLILRNEKWLPLTTLLSIDETSPYYTEKNKGSIFYAESWALTHYLILKDYEERNSRMTQYMRLSSTKLDPLAAAIDSFGDLTKLQKHVEAYVGSAQFNQFTETGIAHVDNSEFEMESITPIQAEAIEADFLACSGRLVEGRDLAQRVLKEDPNNSAAQETMAFLDLADEAVTENSLRSAVKLEPSSADAYDRLASFLRSRGRDLNQAKELESMAISLDSTNLSYRLHLADILVSIGSIQSAADVLRGAALIAKTPQETTEVEQRLAEAETYASTQVANKTETQHAETAAVPGIEKLSHRFIPRGPHLFLVGMIKGVHCSPPALDLMVKSRAKNVALHSENYYKIQITALFAVADDLNPCDDLENRIAKVEYVESMNASDAPRLIAIELHN